MDAYLYDTSIPLISSLQSTFSQQSELMQLVSVLFDPKYAFLIYSPVTYLTSQSVGKKLIMTTIIAEWLNMILKWLLRGERPYWYVHSSGHFDPTQTPIKQFPITCELGPGHPSGHSMLTAAVWYIIMSALLEQGAFKRTKQTKLFAWTSYLAILLTVGISRVFVGCHFPHQCLAGALLGFLVARYISSVELRPWHFIAASFVMFTTAFGTFGLLKALELDPSWTMRLATKHCEHREWIKIDTAPFFSIMRYCGFAFGTGLALQLPHWFPNFASPLVETTEVVNTVTEKENLLLQDNQLTESASAAAADKLDSDEQKNIQSNKISWFSAKLLMALLMARLVDNLSLFVTHSNMTIFYTSALLAYSAFSFTFINL